MKSERWILASDDTTSQTPTPHSGGEGKQLGGYDASKRITATKTGVLITPKILDRNPSRIKIKPAIPMLKGSALPPVTPKSGTGIASGKLRPNSKPPRKRI